MVTIDCLAQANVFFFPTSLPSDSWAHCVSRLCALSIPLDTSCISTHGPNEGGPTSTMDEEAHIAAFDDAAMPENGDILAGELNQFQVCFGFTNPKQLLLLQVGATSTFLLTCLLTTLEMDLHHATGDARNLARCLARTVCFCHETKCRFEIFFFQL